MSSYVIILIKMKSEYKRLEKKKFKIQWLQMDHC